MQLLTKRDEVLEVLGQAQQKLVPLFCPNAESPDEIEGLLLAALDFKKQHGLDDLVMGMGITSCYPDHPQLQRLSLDDSKDVLPTLETWFAWLNVYVNRRGLFEGIRIIPFLDHGWAPDERDVKLMMTPQVQEQFGIIMFDASAFDLLENIRLTRDYVKQAGQRVVVEGCPDKILSEAEIFAKGLSAQNMLTDPLVASEFVKQTGVDLIVPSLGTEHRASGDQVQYHGEIAQKIKAQVGGIMALHGTSSLGDRIGSIAADGIIKVNFYTAMARSASQQLRTSWTQIPTDDPLPIQQACGSQVLSVRRQAVRKIALSMLGKLAQGNG